MLDTCFLLLFLSMCHLICATFPFRPFLSKEESEKQRHNVTSRGSIEWHDGDGSTWRCSSAEIVSKFSLFESNIETNEIGFAQQKHQIIYSLWKWRALVSAVERDAYFPQLNRNENRKQKKKIHSQPDGRKRGWIHICLLQMQFFLK